MRASWSLPLAGLLAVLFNAPSTAHGQEIPSAFDAEAAIEYSQAAIGRTVGDYGFLGRDGVPVRLRDQRGKPVVVNLIYTACIHSCPIIVQTLARAVEVAQDALGADSFSVLTIGFDTDADTPARMRAYASSQDVDLPNWRFLATDEDTVKRLAEDLGFIYFPSSKGFDHLAQVTVLDGEGRVYRQVYGESFNSPALVEPLKDLAFDRQGSLTSLSGLIDRVRLFCTLYDPSSDRYRFDYSIFIGLAIALASLGTIGTLLVRSWLRARRTHDRA